MPGQPHAWRESSADRRQPLRAPPAAQLPGEHSRGEHDEPRGHRRPHPDRRHRRTEQLRLPAGQQWGQWTLVDVAERQMPAGHPEVQLVAVPAVPATQPDQRGSGRRRRDHRCPTHDAQLRRRRERPGRRTRRDRVTRRRHPHQLSLRRRPTADHPHPPDRSSPHRATFAARSTNSRPRSRPTADSAPAPPSSCPRYQAAASASTRRSAGYRREGGKMTRS